MDIEAIRTPKQTACRDQIISVARQLATQSRESVHLRIVADQAGVTTSTVYQYFSSKDELLLACFLEWLSERRRDRYVDTPMSTPSRRSLIDTVHELTISLFSTPRLATYATRAYFTDDHPAGAGLDHVRCALGTTFANEMHIGDANVNSQALGEIVADVWAANMLALVQDRISLPEALIRLERTIAIIQGRATSAGPEDDHPEPGLDAAAR